MTTITCPNWNGQFDCNTFLCPDLLQCRVVFEQALRLQKTEYSNGAQYIPARALLGDCDYQKKTFLTKMEIQKRTLGKLDLFFTVLDTEKSFVVIMNINDNVLVTLE